MSIVLAVCQKTTLVKKASTLSQRGFYTSHSSGGSSKLRILWTLSGSFHGWFSVCSTSRRRLQEIIQPMGSDSQLAWTSVEIPPFMSATDLAQWLQPAAALIYTWYQERPWVWGRTKEALGLLHQRGQTKTLNNSKTHLDIIMLSLTPPRPLTNYVPITSADSSVYIY